MNLHTYAFVKNTSLYVIPNLTTLTFLLNNVDILLGKRTFFKSLRKIPFSTQVQIQIQTYPRHKNKKGLWRIQIPPAVLACSLGSLNMSTPLGALGDPANASSPRRPPGPPRPQNTIDLASLNLQEGDTTTTVAIGKDTYTIGRTNYLRFRLRLQRLCNLIARSSCQFIIFFRSEIF